MQVFLVNAIVFSKYSFGLTPEVFNIVDVIMIFCKFFRMINSKSLKITHIKRIVAFMAISIDNAILLSLQWVTS